MAGVGPPAALVLRQFAHHRAVLSPLFILAVAVAEGGPRPGKQGRGGVGQGGGAGRSNKNCDSDGLAKVESSGCHGPFWNGTRAQPIAQRMGMRWDRSRSSTVTGPLGGARVIADNSIFVRDMKGYLSICRERS